MPAYAFPDKQSYDKMARVVRLRQGLEGGIRPQKIIPRETTFYLGKPDTAFTAGPLTAPNNVVSVWKGPAWGAEDAATGQKIECDYTTSNFATSDYIAVTRYRGKWYVHCFIPGA